MRHTYDVTGMHCASCVAKVTDALKSVEGIEDASVTLEPPRAKVEMGEHVALDVLNQSLRSAGDYGLSETDGQGAPSSAPAAGTTEGPQESLYPLFLIVGYLLGTIFLIAVATGNWSPHTLMRHFMGGFFLVFSFFKFLDLRGFADAYRMYDFLARAWPPWGLAYPFVELGLGMAYLVNFTPVATNLTTLVLMLIGAAGVLKVLLDKRQIRCACLGTALNLPMTKITLVEDLGMAAMAAVMLATL